MIPSLQIAAIRKEPLIRKGCVCLKLLFAASGESGDRSKIAMKEQRKKFGNPRERLFNEGLPGMTFRQRESIRI